jgi:hypothetical protein
LYSAESKWPKTSCGDLATTLLKHRTEAKNNRGINLLTHFLQDDTAIELMRDARRALYRKGDKYQHAGPNANPMVRKVLIQLQPFLISCGISEWKDIRIPQSIDTTVEETIVGLYKILGHIPNEREIDDYMAWQDSCVNE